MGKDTPKTMLFCNTINEVASVANHLLFKLGIHAYDEKFKSPENCLLGIYHSNTWQASKDRILASLKGNVPRSTSMLVLCNSALISFSSLSSCAQRSLCPCKVSFNLAGSVFDTGAFMCAGFDCLFSLASHAFSEDKQYS